MKKINKSHLIKLAILLAGAVAFGADMLKGHFEEMEADAELEVKVNDLVDARLAAYFKESENVQR